MTRSELIQRLALKHNQLSTTDTDESVRLILGSIADRMQDGHRVEIRGFGAFYVTRQNERIGRNPKTGASVIVPEKNTPKFKPGKELRERVSPANED